MTLPDIPFTPAPESSRLRSATMLCLAVLLFLTGWLTAPAPTTAAEPAADSATRARFLVTAGTASMGISVLRVESDGTLSAVPGSPFPTGFGVLSLVVAPDGRTLYVPHAGDGTVTGYRLNEAGALQPIPGANVPVGGPATAARLSPDGSRLFVVVGGMPGHVVSFAVDSSGALTRIAAPAVPVDGLSAVAMAGVDPSGRFVRAVTYIGNTLSSYAIGAGGELTPIGVTPVKLGPVAPGYTPDGRYLYISNEFGFDLSGFAIGANGELTPTPGSPYPTGGVPHGVVVTDDGARLYVPNAVGQSIAGFQVRADGALVPLPGSPYPGPAGTLPGQVALHPDGKYLYLVDVLTTHGTTMVHRYDIRGDGSIAPSGHPPVDTGVVMSDGPVVVLTP